MTSETILEASPASSSYSLPELPSKSLHPDSQSSSEDSDGTSSDSDMTSYAYRLQHWRAKGIVLPEVKISAFTETSQAESSIKVPLQRSYTGRVPVIPSSLADTPCATLGIQGVLDGLNATLRTSYTLDTPSFRSILEDCIENNDDFGTVYGCLRQIWYIDDWSTIGDELRRWEVADREIRREALVGNLIVDPNLSPRRVWDLCSNRVVPWWVLNINILQWLQPISHAWVDENDRMDVWKLINGKEWPVPIPKDASLDLIRIEMLNLGLQYTWLDVLCLRQKGGPKEDLHVEEWRLDVPTIGYVYYGAEVVIYLSGLGLPLSLKEGDLDSDRCWFRRAWTLQEGGWRRIITGDTPDGPLHAKPIDEDEKYKTELLTRFQKQLQLPEGPWWHLFGPLADMWNWVSMNSVDKIAGLAFPLDPLMIPAYHENKSLEDAWTALVNAMDNRTRALFLLLYPGVGLGHKKWRLTWEQAMTEPLPVYQCFVLMCVDCDDKMDEDSFQGPCIENRHVHRLDVELAEGGDRCGELVVQSTDGMPHTFSIRATHQIPIPKDVYTLLASRADKHKDGMLQQYWAVGRQLPGKRFEKVSVIVMDDGEDVKRLEGLGIATKSDNILV